MTQRSKATSIDNIAHSDKKLEQKSKNLVEETLSVQDTSLFTLSS